MSAFNQDLVYRLPKTPIVLIHPRSAERTSIIAALTGEPDTRYYALTETDQRCEALTQQLLRARFGTQPDAFASPKAAGTALGAILLQQRVQRLILDQADWLNEPHLSNWLNGLADWLVHGQLIVSGRELRLADWQPALTEGRARLWAGLESEGPIGDLEVYGFGHSQVWHAGQIRDAWDGPLARRLFYFLIDQSPVSRDQIFATFWPELPIRAATNVFHVTKRKINETIGCEATAFIDRRYVPNPAINIHYDVTAFDLAGEQAASLEDKRLAAEALPLWQKAVALYRQPFLSGDLMPWIVNRRAALQERYAQALANVARHHEQQQDSDHALLYWQRALNELPTQEAWVVHAMTLHAARGDLVAVRDQYELLRNHLSEQLSMQPSRSTIETYQHLIDH